jgi:hypothetical protein
MIGRYHLSALHNFHCTNSIDLIQPPHMRLFLVVLSSFCLGGRSGQEDGGSMASELLFCIVRHNSFRQ